MLGFLLSLLALRLLSTLLGGYGIFCLILSFEVPRLGAQAFLLLATATAICLLASSERRSR
jgi:multisubunit Na+/H+ antiporter MnhB subunit